LRIAVGESSADDSLIVKDVIFTRTSQDAGKTGLAGLAHSLIAMAVIVVIVVIAAIAAAMIITRMKTGGYEVKSTPLVQVLLIIK
jgi:hypothetical protein